MVVGYQEYISGLNGDNPQLRLDSLRKLKEAIDRGDIPKAAEKGYVNNHIHTTYSFSPYSPTKAIWMAYSAGLTTAGIMDHDSISGAREFIEAGKIMKIATTIGVECRVDFSKTPLKGRRINNPDQHSIAYIGLHGIPHTQINRVKEFFAPYTVERNKRNRQMIQKINDIFKNYNIQVDFDQDVVPLSQYHDGGSITERHLLFALSKKIVQSFGKGQKLVDFLTEDLGIEVKPREISFR